MTLRASDIAERVLRRMNVGPFQIRRMTAKAGLDALLGSELRERFYGGLASARFHMRFPWSVAAFAARVLGSFLAARDAFKVRILVKSEPHIRMTGPADHTADIVRVRGLTAH